MVCFCQPMLSEFNLSFAMRMEELGTLEFPILPEIPALPGLQALGSGLGMFMGTMAGPQFGELAAVLTAPEMTMPELPSLGELAQIESLAFLSGSFSLDLQVPLPELQLQLDGLAASLNLCTPSIQQLDGLVPSLAVQLPGVGEAGLALGAVEMGLGINLMMEGALEGFGLDLSALAALLPSGFPQLPAVALELAIAARLEVAVGALGIDLQLPGGWDALGGLCDSLSQLEMPTLDLTPPEWSLAIGNLATLGALEASLDLGLTPPEVAPMGDLSLAAGFSGPSMGGISLAGGLPPFGPGQLAALELNLAVLQELTAGMPALDAPALELPGGLGLSAPDIAALSSATAFGASLNGIAPAFGSSPEGLQGMMAGAGGAFGMPDTSAPEMPGWSDFEPGTPPYMSSLSRPEMPARPEMPTADQASLDSLQSNMGALSDGFAKPEMPAAEVPEMGGMPGMEAPGMGGAEMGMPSVEAPEMGGAGMEMPGMEVPSIETPDVTMPAMEVPPVTAGLPDLSGLSMAAVFANSFSELTGQALLRELPCPVMFCQASSSGN